jgi:hypothetical protein
MKILFVYYIRDEKYWKDGLCAAIELLSRKHDVTKLNLAKTFNGLNFEDFDFVLGWGAFCSPAETLLTGLTKNKKGLCLAGNATPVPKYINYDVIFYETDWIKDNYLKDVQVPLVKAFGVNDNIFYRNRLINEKIWDYLSVGAFAYWKNHHKMIDKKGTRLCIGEIQKDNMLESLDIIRGLVTNDIAVSGMVTPKKLNKIYSLSKTVYIPATLEGGGERAVLEARTCGCNVIVENEKLAELNRCRIPNHTDYFNRLNETITAICTK